MRRRVVISGAGFATGLGLGRDALWAALVEGRGAIGALSVVDGMALGVRVGAEIKDLSARDVVPKHYRKAVKVMARDSEIAVIAASWAVRDAGLVTREQEGAAPTYPAARVGCQVGAGLIPTEIDEVASAFSTSRDENGEFSLTRWGEGAINNLQPLWMLKYLPNMLACHVGIVHGCEAPSNTITCSEASGLLSLGESARVIERGDAEACFSGGAESKFNPLGLLRLRAWGRLAHGEAEARGARPYDPESGGTIAGEGGGILILEEREACRARGATPHAELLGFGAAHSARSIGTLGPSASGELDSTGLAYAIDNALQDAGVPASEIDAVVPQASGHGPTDRAELAALRAVFGARLASLPLVTLTPMLGELMAGRGGVQAGVAALCLREQRLPARLHAGRPEPGVRAGAEASRPAPLRRVLVCTSSMGGSNAALVLGAR